MVAGSCIKFNKIQWSAEPISIPPNPVPYAETEGQLETMLKSINMQAQAT